LRKCQFTAPYYNYEISRRVDFNCPEERLALGLCIFHDKDYLQDKMNDEEHKRKLLERLKDKVNDATSNHEPLLCIGFQLPDFSLSDLRISKDFTILVYFFRSQFFGKAYFSGANFQGKVDFSEATFKREADFSKAIFQNEAIFSGAEFLKETAFSNVTFKEEAVFSKATFKDRVLFLKAKFPRRNNLL
jgi:Pentapeptide repeats (9 copies)